MEIEEFNNLKHNYPCMGDLFNKDKLKQPIRDVQQKDSLIPAFLSLKPLVKQHIDSFNHFLNVDIHNIIMSKHNRRIESEVDPNFYLQYNKIRVEKPSYKIDHEIINPTPHECRIRDLTYSGDIYVDIEYRYKGQIIQRNDIQIGSMPIMIGSTHCHLTGKNEAQLAKMNECIYDPKGYFILKGTEKVVLIHEQMAKNRIFVEYDSKNKCLFASVQSKNFETISKTNIIIKDGKLYVKSNSFTEPIPIFIMLKALYIESEYDIIQLIGTESYIIEYLSLCLQEIAHFKIYSQESALKYLSTKIRSSNYESNRNKNPIEDARDIISTVMLAHVPCKKFDYFPKAFYLCLMVRKLLEAVKDPTKEDDKDYYGNKRLECAGKLIGLLFEDKFKTFNSDLKKQIDKDLNRNKFNLQNISLRQDIITEGILRALSSGKWVIKRFKMDRAGVTQVLNRLTFISQLGMMTKIQSHFEKTRKMGGPRALQGSHWGMICPSDTPEGESCGLVKNLSLLTYITNDQPDSKIFKIALNLGMEDLSLLNGSVINKNCIVFLNGLTVGVVKYPIKFIEQFKRLRRKQFIDKFVSIYEKSNSIYIACDDGRLCRPLIIVENGFPLLQPHHITAIQQKIIQFDDLIDQGIIEYIDVNESDNCLIALMNNDINENTTHLEIEPYSILGAVSGLIPYPHHNQSPRNTYQCAMGKQAIGSIGYNQLNRVDTLLYLMIYPQIPLVRTKTIDLTNFTKLPAGHNASVAVMSYSGYDIEDAVILNKASLDRGFGRVATYRRVKTEFKTQMGVMDSLKAPDQLVSNERTKKNSQLKALDSSGLAKVGERLQKNDIFVNKVVPVITPETSQIGFNKQNLQWQDKPERYGNAIPSTVDRVILTSNSEHQLIVKTMLRQIRRPELGDKFSSRHGQKGVCGLIVNQEDMPFAESGWCPDLIMNPHGYPSRMTVGKMIELIAGKAGALSWQFKYGTAFGGDKVKDLGKILIDKGFSYDGKDCLISGITGEYINCYVFSGPIYYQRLKHMVQDKIHARAKGLNTKLTRQPLQGRSKGGGNRIGEMERDCLIGYGATNLLIERLVLSSDLFWVYICKKCGFFQHDTFCVSCNTQDVHKIRMPYACKLMFQELISMNIRPKFNLIDE